MAERTLVDGRSLEGRLIGGVDFGGSADKFKVSCVNRNVGKILR